MEKKEISMQLYTTRHFQPYDPILKFLSISLMDPIEVPAAVKFIHGLLNLDLRLILDLKNSSWKIPNAQPALIP